MGSSFSLCGWKLFSKTPSSQAVHIPLSVLEQPTPLSPHQEPIPPAPQEPIQETSPIEATVSSPITVAPPKDEDHPAGSATPVTVAIPSIAPHLQPLNAPPQINDPERNAEPVEVVDSKEIEDIRKECPQFRVLLMGKANSGKTTIIRKMCDSDEDPTVYDEEGNEFSASVLEQPIATRGMHNIHHQIIHNNNPNLIFHDSRGFEASSTEEVERVKEFIKDKQAKTKLSDRLHAIWFCIPVDYTRVASKAELAFFEENTGDIPVIVVFTKWDGRIIRAFNTLQNDEGRDVAQAKKEAPALARRILEEEFVPIFNTTTYPPASYVVLGYMHKPETKCGELVEKTEAALNNNVLKKLFVSVQTHNLELCIKGSIKEAVSEYLFSSSSNSGPDHGLVLRVVLTWFPHTYWTHDYSKAKEHALGHYLLEREIVKSFQPVLSDSEQAFVSPRLQHLHNVACRSTWCFSCLLFTSSLQAVAIVATRSFDVKKRTGNTEDAVKTSIEEYLQSPQYHVVKEAVKTKFLQYVEYPALYWLRRKDETVTRISEELQKICLDNLLASSN